jgi:predicted PurR-regulated permease PerM
VDFLRARREQHDEPAAQEPELPGTVEDVWGSAAQLATVGIFVLLLTAFVYVCRPVLLPVSAALIIGTTLAPIVKFGNRHRVSPWATAIVLGLLLLIGAAAVATLLAAPMTQWIGRAPEIGASIKEKLHVLSAPLEPLRQLYEILMSASGPTVAVEPSQWVIVTPVIAFVTPTAVQLTLFFVTLIFFLATQMDFRRYMVSFFTTRDAKLRFLRIASEIEENLATYVATVTVINVMLGAAVGIGAWLFGFPNPFILGTVATLLNYMPYIGAACMTAILLGVGLMTFSSLTYALIPPAAFVGLAALEGQFITPAVLGHRLTLNPLVVLLALAFWAWLWGPMGGFLAVPFTVVGMVILHHLFPPDEDKLPG